MPPHRASFNTAAILWMLLWALSFNASMSLAKILSKDISSFMIVFIRLCFGLVFLFPFIAKEGMSLFQTQRWGLHILRMIFVCLGMVCTYYAYTRLPLAFVISIGFTEPIVISLLSVFFLGDRLSFTQWGLIFLGYLGVLIMIKPESGQWGIAVFVALAANVFSSCAIIIVKKLSQSESTLKILVYFQILSVFFVGFFAIFFWQTPSLRDTLILLLIGGAGSISQLCTIKAMQNGDPSALSPFEYTRLVFAIPIGMIFFDETPTVWAILGSLAIIACNLLLSFHQFRKKKQRNL